MTSYAAFSTPRATDDVSKTNRRYLFLLFYGETVLKTKSDKAISDKKGFDRNLNCPDFLFSIYDHIIKMLNSSDTRENFLCFDLFDLVSKMQEMQMAKFPQVPPSLQTLCDNSSIHQGKLLASD